jgi:glycosyltransferase involved in cell wall biosynthesis
MTDGQGGQTVDAGRPIDPIVASVVIPAHNEAAVIGRLLTALRDIGHGPGNAADGGLDGGLDRFEVIVACNGCTDATAAIARDHGARVIETPVASKIAALDAADAAATAFPRLYIDADVTLTGRAAADVARALASPGGPLCAAPPMSVDLAGRPWAVRAFYDVWCRIPYLRDTHVGSGVFALSEAGRRRFDRFPDVIADDLFVRNLFGRSERMVVATDPFVIQAPRTLRALVRRRVRIHAGNAEQASHPELAALPGARERSGPWWRAVVERPSLALKAVPYALVNALAKVRARRLVRSDREIGWGRDETTRTAPASLGAQR